MKRVCSLLLAAIILLTAIPFGASAAKDVVWGDANGDDKINAQDVIRLKNYLSNLNYETGASSFTVSAGADANGDEKINAQDVIRLKNYLANYDYGRQASDYTLGPGGHKHEYKTETLKKTTCTTSGSARYTCTICDYTYTAEVAAFGHAWSAASCTAPKTCTRCGITEGKALGHAWSAATCTSPKTCTRCGATEGSAPGHAWSAATCTAPKTCTRCGATEGGALGHSWAAATCTAPKTCTRCGITEGGALGHSWTAATCTAPKTCTRCGATEGGALGHTFNSDDVCTRCGQPALTVTLKGSQPITISSGRTRATFNSVDFKVEKTYSGSYYVTVSGTYTGVGSYYGYWSCYYSVRRSDGVVVKSANIFIINSNLVPGDTYTFSDHFYLDNLGDYTFEILER